MGNELVNVNKADVVEVLEPIWAVQPGVSRGAAPAMPEFTGSLYGLFLNQLDASQKTKETYTRNLRQFFSWLDSQGITQPTRDDVLAYKNDLKARLKPATVQNYMVVVKVFFEWAETVRAYPNVARGVKSGKVDRFHKKDHLQVNEVKAIVEKMDRTTLTGARDYAIFVLMSSCALRTIEVVRANKEDLRANAIYVQGKGHEEKGQRVNLHPAAERAIREYLVIRGKVKDDEPLFASASNKNMSERLTTRSVSRIVKNAMKAAGYDSDRLTAHSLRHTAVNMALDAGMPIQTVSRFARHTDISTTMIYVHSREEETNECSAKVGAMLFGD